MILQERLSAEIEEKGMLPDTQAGFRKGRSTIDNIYVLNYAIEKEIKKEGGKCYVLFADLKAAFDLVNRRKMIEMLRSRKVSEKLTNRIAEIYEETISVVRVNEKESRAFWTTMGVRQGCPLSPTLFALYLADIEEHMAKGQTGGLVIGKKKFWTLSYADDLVCVSKTQEEMKSLIKRLGTYLKKKDMILNTEKTKIMKFRKGGGRDSKEKWKWQQDDIESVKEFKYLGYTYKSNNTEDAHIKDITKRAAIAMAQIWSIGERKFKHDIKLRMLLFDYTVKSILMYAAEIWGWKEQEKVENIQVKYLRWILGLEVHTPKYIVLEETKRNKLRVEAGKRAMKFEEKMRRNNNKEILFDCWNNIAKGDTQQGKWERKRAQFYERNGHSTRDIENRRRLGQNIIEEIVNRDADIQRQEQIAKIENARYNTRYKQLITIGLPRYMKKEQKSEGIKTIARFRCGNEENANMYWRKEEDRKCRLCKEEQETLEHLLTECEKRRDGAYRVEDVMDDSGKGLAWMRQLLLERKN